MPADFSFDRDVAPYAGSVFGRVENSSFLSGARKAELNDRLVTVAEAARKREDEREKDELAKELTRVRIDSERAALEDARWKMGEERRAAAAAPAVSSAFDAILSDATLDQKQKKAAIHKWAANNADTIFRSPILANKYRATVAAAEPDETRELTPYQELSTRLRIGAEQRAEERYQTEQKQKAEKDAEDRRNDALRRYDDTLKGIKIIDKDPVDMKPITPAFENPLDRERLLDLVLPTITSRAELDALEKADALDLYRRAAAARRQLSLPDVPDKKDEAKSEIRSLFRLK